jgi:hypothetical protein
MDSQILLTLVGLLWGASAIAGGYVAVQKGREVHEGVIFGVVFGPLGMLAVAGLPNVKTPTPPDPSRRSNQRSSVPIPSDR